MKQRQWVVNAVPIFAFLMSSLSVAETRFEPLFSAAIGYDDNFTLEADDELEDSVSIGAVTLGAVITRSGERSNTLIVPNIEVRNFGGSEQDYDAAEGGITFVNRTLFETAEIRVLASYFNELTYDSEFVDIDYQDGDAGFFEDDATGNVRQRIRRETLRLNPEWFWDISPRTELSVRGRFMDSSFDKDSVLNDFNESRINLTWTRKLSERLQFGINAYGGIYNSEASLQDSELRGAEARLSWKLSERTAGWLRIGSSTNSDNDNETSDVNAVIGALGIRREFERGRLRFDFLRNQSGSSLGEVVNRNNVRITYRYSLTERVQMNFGARYSFIERSDENADSNDRELGIFELGLGWDISRRWNLGLRTTQRFLDVEQEPGQADGNEIFLTVRYVGQQPIRISEGMIQSPWRSF